MTINQTVEAFHVRDKSDYAVFVVLQRKRADADSGYFMLSIESSFGYGYAYAWSNPGPDFYNFLCRQVDDPWYVGSKMCQGEQKTPDWAATAREIRKYICEQRRQGSWTAAKARAAWPDIFDSETGFSSWDRDQYIIDSAYEHIVSSHGRRYIEFMALHKAFWPGFCEQLKAAKSAREESARRLSELNDRCNAEVAAVLKASNMELG